MTGVLLGLLLAYDPGAHLQALQPRMPAPRRQRLARLISQEARRHDLDPALLVQILQQESGFRPGLLRCYPGRGCDAGMGQVNSVWVRKWDLSTCRLLWDEAYAVAQVARILAWQVRHFGDPLRYHDARPSRQAAYAQALARWEPP